MLFATSPLAPRQFTSQRFKDFGIQNQAPASVADLNITATSSAFRLNVAVFFSTLWTFVASFLTGKATGTSNVNSMATTVKKTLFTNPPLVITFTNDKKTEEIESKMATLGFSKQSQNKYNYYKGPASDEAIAAAVQLGAHTDAYAPFGSTNLNGIICLSMINRILHGALGYLATITEGMSFPDIKNVERASSWKEYAITSEASLGPKGIFFPYFTGLCLPDKNFTPGVITRLFSPLFGEKTSLVNAIKTISEGWSSLSTTDTGMQISHLVLGISLAESAQCCLRPVILNNVYCGFVLEGNGFGIYKKGEGFTTPYAKETLAAEINGMNGHDNSLKEIAAILSLKRPTGLDPKESFKVDVEHLRSPRHIHYLLRIRDFDTNEQTTLREKISKLTFTETFWDPVSSKHIALAIEAISKREFLSVTAPFYLKGGEMFTKDPLASTLGAFGLMAPTLIGFGNTMSITLNRGGKFYEGTKNCTLKGIPIFVKPMTQAITDWQSVLRSGVVYFKHTGNDKNGIARIANIKTRVPEGTKEYHSIVDSIVEGIVSSIQKRKRGSDDKDDKEDIKKIRTAGALEKERHRREGVMGLLQLEGFAPSIPEPSDAAMEEDPFAD